MLFNYSKCECCKNNKNDVKITLHHLLPVNMCNMICDYILHCKYCNSLLEDEIKFTKHKQEENVSKIELQIRFFQLYNKPPFEWKDVKKVKIQKMNAIIDKSVCDDIMFKKAMKSYFSFWCRLFTKTYLPAVGHKERLRDETKWHQGEAFPYYKSLFKDDMIVKFLIYEYLLALIGSDIEYMELDDLHNYLEDIFPKNIFP